LGDAVLHPLEGLLDPHCLFLFSLANDVVQSGFELDVNYLVLSHHVHCLQVENLLLILFFERLVLRNGLLHCFFDIFGLLFIVCDGLLELEKHFDGLVSFSHLVNRETDFISKGLLSVNHF